MDNGIGKLEDLFQPEQLKLLGAVREVLLADPRALETSKEQVQE